MTKLVWLLAFASLAYGQDPAEILRKSVQRDGDNYARRKDYTYQEMQETRVLDKNGAATRVSSETHDILILSGRPYERLTAKDGKPLSEKEERREQEKIDKESARRIKDTAKERAELEKDRRDRREFAQQIPVAYNVQLLGEEPVSGHTAWKLSVDPKPGYKAPNKEAEVLKKVKGTVWVDQETYQLVKFDIDVIETFSWGFFVLRIPPGAKITYEQNRVNDEVWLPREIHVRADPKIALLKTFHIAMDIAYQDYRKFQSDSQIVSSSAAP